MSSFVLPVYSSDECSAINRINQIQLQWLGLESLPSLRLISPSTLSRLIQKPNDGTAMHQECVVLHVAIL